MKNIGNAEGSVDVHSVINRAKLSFVLAYRVIEVQPFPLLISATSVTGVGQQFCKSFSLNFNRSFLCVGEPGRTKGVKLGSQEDLS
jgi:hypothetical protein